MHEPEIPPDNPAEMLAYEIVDRAKRKVTIQSCVARTLGAGALAAIALLACEPVLASLLKALRGHGWHGIETAVGCFGVVAAFGTAAVIILLRVFRDLAGLRRLPGKAGDFVDAVDRYDQRQMDRTARGPNQPEI